MNIHTACRVTVDLAALQENFRLLSAYANDITAALYVNSRKHRKV